MSRLTLFVYGMFLFFFHLELYAAGNYVCPTTYQTIMPGFTMAQVQAACGKPTSSQTITQNVNTPINYEQWVYTLKNVTPEQFSNLTPELIITFEGDHATEITVNNQNASMLFYCYRNQQINVGSTQEQVRQACGVPLYVNAIQRGHSETVELTQWTYDYGPYRPQIIVTFNNNSLTDIKMGH